LKINRLGDCITFAHAGITAEGDNRVLFQKVAKELLDKFVKGSHSIPLGSSAESKGELEETFSLLCRREKLCFETLSKAMMKTLGQKEEVFKVWMTQQSDLVQRTALAFGQRSAFERALIAVKEQKSANLKDALTKVTLLTGLAWVEKDLGWFVAKGLVTAGQAETVFAQRSKLCKEVAGFAMHIVEAFGIPEAVYHAPIALDWISYNKFDNRGEILQRPLAEWPL
jgi:acyl-CoA oxidase